MSVVVHKPCAVVADSGLVLVQCGATAATLEPRVAEQFGTLLVDRARTALAQRAAGAIGEPEHPSYDIRPAL